MVHKYNVEFLVWQIKEVARHEGSLASERMRWQSSNTELRRLRQCENGSARSLSRFRVAGIQLDRRVPWNTVKFRP
jgi:hypothetical protein